MYQYMHQSELESSGSKEVGVKFELHPIEIYRLLKWLS